MPASMAVVIERHVASHPKQPPPAFSVSRRQTGTARTKEAFLRQIAGRLDVAHRTAEIRYQAGLP